ncbi:MAG: tRNA (N6-isopentenyl adenosine(37)-C2)-methylthiotransferase MiaB [Deltaproteobacteria bacterium]|nr:tRNA (N6-isopentenyl adenosine(37)-C2)-methylthiotransferase MiaB [Deltaproteobacteria bacterium]
MKQRQLYVETFGCQMNDYDSEIMVCLMEDKNYVQTQNINQADLILLNTCSIREKAEQKVYSYLGRLRGLKEKNPDLLIGITGCVAQQHGKKLLNDLPYLDLVVGTHGIYRLPQLVEEINKKGHQICWTNFDYKLNNATHPGPNQIIVKANLAIMQGCDNFCTYCVVPYVRGREISRPVPDILEEAGGLLANGVKEITLLGQNVNSYGRGLEPKITFTGLIKKIADLPPALSRLRFVTSHPKDLSVELIRAFDEVKPLCEHVHLPVQSGSTRILKAMHRKYTREEYLSKVAELRDVCPDIALTTDVIVGFPGETQADFDQTMDLLDRVNFDGMFSFKYSDRPMTQAMKLRNKIPEEVKSARLTELQALQKNISLKKNQALVGQELEVLVEGPSKRIAGQLTGRTRTNKIVNFACETVSRGSLVNVLIEAASANTLRGTVRHE